MLVTLTCVLPDLTEGIPIDFVELAAAALHKPNLEESIVWQRAKERFAGSRPVICSEDRLVELLFESECMRDVESL